MTRASARIRRQPQAVACTCGTPSQLYLVPPLAKCRLLRVVAGRIGGRAHAVVCWDVCGGLQAGHRPGKGIGGRRYQEGGGRALGCGWASDVASWREECRSPAVDAVRCCAIWPGCKQARPSDRVGSNDSVCGYEGVRGICTLCVALPPRGGGAPTRRQLPKSARTRAPFACSHASSEVTQRATSRSPSRGRRLTAHRAHASLPPPVTAVNRTSFSAMKRLYCFQLVRGPHTPTHACSCSCSCVR